MKPPDPLRPEARRPAPSAAWTVGADPAAAPARSSTQAFLLAVAAWSGPAGSPGPGAAAPPVRFHDRPDARLGPELRAEIEPFRDRPGGASGSAAAASTAVERLRRLHRAAARPDLDRIHPSWLLRALREEPRSVRQALARRGPPRVRRLLILEDGSLADQPAGAGPIVPEVLGWVEALWTERLVGDVPERADDPPAIAALTRLSLGAGCRLARMTGLVKLALAGAVGRDLPNYRPHPGDPDRIARFRWSFPPVDRAPRDVLRRDLRTAHDQSKTAGGPARWLALAGLATLARLLASAEPHRARWALQHAPYPIAKRIRNLMPRRRSDSPLEEAVQWLDRRILAVAWDRLEEERRIAPTPGRRRPTTDAGEAPR